MQKLADNRRARFDFQLGQSLVAGLVLTGPETKSAKLGHISLKGSYITLHDHFAELLNCHISPYPYSPDEHYNPTRPRRILLNKRELAELHNLGSTLIPTEVTVTPKGWVKLRFSVATGRKKADKRAYLKARDDHREARAATI